MHYYHFVASLPVLQQQKELPLEPSLFLEQCQLHLSTEHYRELSALAAAYELGVAAPYQMEEGLGEFAQKCLAYRESLYAALVSYRKLPAHIDAAELSREIVLRVSIAQAFADAEQIASEDDPYRAEILFMDAIWQYVESCEASYAFSFENVLAYCVKLSIVQRQNNLTKIQGKENFRTALDRILESSSL